MDLTQSLTRDAGTGRWGTTEMHAWGDGEMGRSGETRIQELSDRKAGESHLPVAPSPCLQSPRHPVTEAPRRPCTARSVNQQSAIDNLQCPQWLIA